MHDGDFVEIEFIGRIKDTGEIFDLTDAEVAKKEGIFDKDHKYGPAPVIVGSKSVVPGVEEKIKELGVGQEAEFDIKYERGFGKRDPKFIQIISIAKFYEQKINPVPGAFVNIDNRNCRIQSVSGGRVRVDFNHPLAGKDLLYKLKITKHITDTKEKIGSLLNSFGVEGDISVENEKVKMKLKKSNQLIEKIIEESVKKWVKEIKSVEFTKDDANKTDAQQSLDKLESNKNVEENKK